MSIKNATDYLNNHAKSVKVNDKIYVEKSEVIHSLQFAAKVQGFLYEEIRPESSGYYLVKEYKQTYSKTAYYNAQKDVFKIGWNCLDVEIWGHNVELEVTK